ncbi:hypothetical protein ACVBEF_04280 [Glaciimonas sp. GG7]
MQKKLTKLTIRLKWEWYRLAGTLGVPGLSAGAVLIVAAVAHQAYVAPSIHKIEQQLKRTASLQIALMEEIKDSRNRVSVPHSTLSAGQQDVLDLAKKMALDKRDVKYQQIQRGKKDAGQDGRILITLPTSGEYPQFREMMAELAVLPGVWVETFSLSRKTSSDVMLDIEMKLSVTKVASKDATKDKNIEVIK